MTGSEQRSHGMAGDNVAPDWAPLETTEVADILGHYPGLGGAVDILWHSPRPFSAAARVTTGNHEVFVKRHHQTVRRAGELATEHAFMAHLHERGIPVSRVLPDRSGHTVVIRGPWVYEVHAIATGIDLYRDRFSWEPLTDLTQAHTGGRMLAKLHQAAADFKAPQRDTWILVSRDDLLRATNPAATLEAQFERRPALAEHLARHDWKRDLAPLLQRQQTMQARIHAQPRLWTHNDWHISNLCWSGHHSDAAITTVMDFGLAAPTFALYDLATAIERNAVAWLHPERGMQAIFPDTARALIDGYAEVLPLSNADHQLLVDLLPIVHIDFALSEIEYFHGITRSTADADVAYHDFLLGHAAWFDSAPGRAFLRALR